MPLFLCFFTRERQVFRREFLEPLLLWLGCDIFKHAVLVLFFDFLLLLLILIDCFSQLLVCLFCLRAFRLLKHPPVIFVLGHGFLSLDLLVCLVFNFLKHCMNFSFHSVDNALECFGDAVLLELSHRFLETVLSVKQVL